MISEASVFWDSVVILKKQSKQKVIDREKKGFHLSSQQASRKRRVCGSSKTVLLVQVAIVDVTSSEFTKKRGDTDVDTYWYSFSGRSRWNMLCTKVKFVRMCYRQNLKTYWCLHCSAMGAIKLSFVAMSAIWNCYLCKKIRL